MQPQASAGHSAMYTQECLSNERTGISGTCSLGLHRYMHQVRITWKGLLISLQAQQMRALQSRIVAIADMCGKAACAVKALT